MQIDDPGVHNERLTIRRHARRPGQPLPRHARTIGGRRRRKGAASDQIVRSQRHGRLSADGHARIGHAGLRLPRVRAHHLSTDMNEKARHRVSPDSPQITVSAPLFTSTDGPTIVIDAPLPFEM